MRQLTHGSLFAGIGGFDLGFERAGMRTVWQVEIDEYCRRVLAKHFPHAERFNDVRKCCGEMPHIDHADGCRLEHLRTVDVVSGGFPCQDVSHAGRRIGIDGERSGLWREMRRIVRQLQPKFVVVENVTGLLDRGIQRVLGEMAEDGFDAEWCVLPACAFGAPHPRERVFIVAYPQGERQGQLRRIERPRQSKAYGNLRWKEPEPGIERVVNGIPNRVDRLRSLGNAVVPQIAEWIGRRIVEIAQ